MKWNRKWKIPHTFFTVLGRDEPCVSDHLELQIKSKTVS